MRVRALSYVGEDLQGCICHWAEEWNWWPRRLDSVACRQVEPTVLGLNTCCCWTRLKTVVGIQRSTMEIKTRVVMYKQQDIFLSWTMLDNNSIHELANFQQLRIQLAPCTNTALSVLTIEALLVRHLQ